MRRFSLEDLEELASCLPRSCRAQARKLLAQIRKNPGKEQRAAWKAAGKCGNCGGDRTDPRFVDCDRCRGSGKKWRTQRAKDNRCICGAALTGDTSRCDNCLAILRQKHSAKPKQVNLCERCGEPRPPKATKYCSRCAAQVEKKRISKSRAKARRLKLCWCGNKLKKGDFRYCFECRQLRVTMSKSQWRYLQGRCTDCGKQKKKKDGFRTCKDCRAAGRHTREWLGIQRRTAEVRREKEARKRDKEATQAMEETDE